MKKMLLLVLVVRSVVGLSQITVTIADMPKPGDMIRHSITTNIQQDFTLTGQDTTWDFSGLAPMLQRVDTFVNVTETPSLFWFVFTPGMVSNLALKGTALPAVPGISMTQRYTFYKSSNAAFSDVGFAFLLSGLPVMLKYNNPDIYCQLPCTPGSNWTSLSEASISMPGLGYFSLKRIRNSAVDGYGTLITPFGSFETIRVKSEVVENDSIFIDSLNFGMPLNQASTEYRWLAKGKGTPVLKIVQQGLIATATYQDIDRDLGMVKMDRPAVHVYPNPTSGTIRIGMPLPDQELTVDVVSPEGKLLSRQQILLVSGNSGEINVPGDHHGLLFLRIAGNNFVLTTKVMIYD